jgi:lipid A 3-O-deacylase
MMARRCLYLILLGIILSASSPSHLQLGVGGFNIRRTAWLQPQLLVEYRRNINFYDLRPLVAFTCTPHGSGYVCAGAAYDVFFGKNKLFACTPSFAAGIYFKGDKGKVLGYPLEFRSSIEFSRVLSNKARVGLQFYHISNASLGWCNPGSESLILFYALPLD